MWSGGGVLTGLATGFGTMVGSRLVLGAGEPASYPAGGRAIREWAPRSERGLAAAWLNGGAYAGPAIGALAVGWIVTEFSYRDNGRGPDRLSSRGPRQPGVSRGFRDDTGLDVRIGLPTRGMSDVNAD